MRGAFRTFGGISRFWRRNWGKGAALPSLVKAMDTLVPRKVMREVVASSHDRRQWGVLAAAWVGVSEREFFSTAAREMKVDWDERVSPPDLSVFGGEAKRLLAELRRVGAVVSLEGRVPTRFSAVDPAEVRALSLYDGSVPVALASWSDISRALDATERMILEDETNAEYREVKRRQEVCGKILDILVREAASHGAHSVEVVTSEEKTRYQFCTSHGRVAAGVIHPEVIQDLLKYLCSLEGSVIKTESKGDVCLRSMGSSSNFRLSWGGVAALPATIVESAHREKPAVTRGAPVQQPALRTERERVRSSDSSELHPILVVDDNPMFCRVLERLLKKENVAPCFADNGILALERLTTSHEVLPKIIICDLHMPVMNGRELLAAVKSDPRLRDIPVIMLTSDDDVDAELQLLAGGADAFISKAKDPRVLTAQVQRLLRRGPLREAA